MNIIVVGGEGKMGKRVCEMLPKCGFGVISVDINTPFSQIDESKEINGLIDFSVPSAISDNLKYAVNRKIPAVIAVTGYSDKEKTLIYKAAEKIPIMLSRNLSDGFEGFLKCAEMTASRHFDWDTEIIEIHHNGKKDAPSGSALELFERIGKNKKAVIGRSGTSLKGCNEIGISSIRIGKEIGKHTVIFEGKNERLVFTHEALNADAFAEGAIKALSRLLKKKNGLYTQFSQLS